MPGYFVVTTIAIATTVQPFNSGGGTGPLFIPKEDQKPPTYWKGNS